MKDKISVSKIEITIDGKVISLTLAQAKELTAILNETFPEKKFAAPIFVERHWPYYPLWNYATISTPSPGIQFTCDSSALQSNTLCLTTNSLS